ncbi:MAG: hypothetical protein RLT87_08500 [Gammaproteobacteria bacterium]
MLHFPRFSPTDLKLLMTQHGCRATHKTMDVYEVVSQDGITRAIFFKNRDGYGACDTNGVEIISARNGLQDVFRSPLVKKPGSGTRISKRL